MICLRLYWGYYVGHSAFISIIITTTTTPTTTTTTTTTTPIITVQEAAWVKAGRAAWKDGTLANQGETPI